MSSDAALDVAAKALARRDRTVAQMERHLAEHGFDEASRAAALDSLIRVHVLDDVRFAENRAAALAERGAGNAAIRSDLREAGVTGEDVERALALLATEHVRAERIVERRGASSKTARYLAGKGFSEETVVAVVARAAGEALR